MLLQSTAFEVVRASVGPLIATGYLRVQEISNGTTSTPKSSALGFLSHIWVGMEEAGPR